MDSDLLSSTTAPDVSLDIQSHTAEYQIIQKLHWVGKPVSVAMNDIVKGLLTNEQDINLHFALESSLFERMLYYKNDILKKQQRESEYQQIIKQLQMNDADCQNCLVLQEQLNLLAEQISVGCQDCQLYARGLTKVIKQLQQTATANSQALIKDLTNLSNKKLVQTSDYQAGPISDKEGLKQEVEAIKQSYQQLTDGLQQENGQLNEELKKIVTLVSQTLNDPNQSSAVDAVNSLINIQSMSNQQSNIEIQKLKQAIVDINKQFNQEKNEMVAVIQAQDEKMEQMQAQLSRSPITQQGSPMSQQQQDIQQGQQIQFVQQPLDQNQLMQLYQQQQGVPQQQSVFPQFYQGDQYQQPQQNQGQGQGRFLVELQQKQQLFVELLNQELFNVAVPGDERDFITRRFSTNVVIRKSVTDLLREALQVLSKVRNMTEIQVEQALQPPPLVVQKQLDESELSCLTELQRVNSLVLTLRYALEQCLERELGNFKNDQTRKIEQNANKEQLFNQQQLIKQLSLIIKYLFGMGLWDEQAYARKAFGSVSGAELMKLLQSNTDLQQGFSDFDFLRQLNDLFLALATQDPVVVVEKLADLLNSSQGLKIVPELCSRLAKASLELQGETQQVQLKAESEQMKVQQLENVVKQDHLAKQEYIKQLQGKDVEGQQLQKQISELKNNVQNLEIEKDRVQGLEQLVNEVKRENEKLRYNQGENEQKIANFTDNNKQLQEKFDQISKNYKLLEEEKSKIQKRNREIEEEANEIAMYRQEARQKNQELVNIIYSMEDQIKVYEKEGAEMKRIIGQELPAFEDTVSRQQKQIQGYLSEIENLSDQKRQMTIQLKDQEVLYQKSEKMVQELQKEFQDRFEKLGELQAANKQLELELDQITGLFQKEQEKAQFYNQELNNVVQRNQVLEAANVKNMAEVETMRFEKQDDDRLLMEAQAKMSILTQTLNEEKQKAEQFHGQLTQTMGVQGNLQADAARLLERNAELERQLQQLKLLHDDETKVKNHLVTKMSEQVSNLVQGQVNNGSVIQRNVETDCNKQFQKYLDMQTDQANATIQKLSTDNELLINELAERKQTWKDNGEQNKKLIKENAVLREQLEVLTAAQEKIADKSKKLLKTTNILKNKLVFFARTFVRVCGYTDNKVQYSADFLIEQGTVIESAATDLSLGNTNKLEQTVEFHSSDCVKIPLPGEAQLRILCELLKSGSKMLEINQQVEKLGADNVDLMKQLAECRRTISEAEIFRTQAEKQLGQLKNEKKKLNETIQIMTNGVKKGVSITTKGLGTGLVSESTAKLESFAGPMDIMDQVRQSQQLQERVKAEREHQKQQKQNKMETLDEMDEGRATLPAHIQAKRQKRAEEAAPQFRPSNVPDQPSIDDVLDDIRKSYAPVKDENENYSDISVRKLLEDDEMEAHHLVSSNLSTEKRDKVHKSSSERRVTEAMNYDPRLEEQQRQQAFRSMDEARPPRPAQRRYQEEGNFSNQQKQNPAVLDMSRTPISQVSNQDYSPQNNQQYQPQYQQRQQQQRQQQNQFQQSSSQPDYGQSAYQQQRSNGGAGQRSVLTTAQLVDPTLSDRYSANYQQVTNQGRAPSISAEPLTAAEMAKIQRMVANGQSSEAASQRATATGTVPIQVHLPK